MRLNQIGQQGIGLLEGLGVSQDLPGDDPGQPGRLRRVLIIDPISGRGYAHDAEYDRTRCRDEGDEDPYRQR